MSAPLVASNLSAGQTVAIETGGLVGGLLRLSGYTAPLRQLPLTGAKSDAGVPLTATAAAGALGVARTAGSSLQLVGEVTTASSKTDKALWELNVVTNGGTVTAIPVVVNAQYGGTGTVTGSSTVLALSAYSEAAGVETALTVSGGSQQLTSANQALSWSIAGSGIADGGHIVVEAVATVVTTSGNASAVINSIGIGA